MIEARQTDLFAGWLRKLRDEQARARIQIRIRRVSLGNFGDSKPLGEGVSELRIDYGPGYRVYFHRVGNLIVLLLIGGTRKTQDEDIAKAKKLAKEAKSGS
jgi:putative addiction module killer protein